MLERTIYLAIKLLYSIDFKITDLMVNVTLKYGQ